MPYLTERPIFISHAWSYDEQYNTVESWLKEAANFSWKNYSVPQTKQLDTRTNQQLKVALTNQISPAKVVVIIAGMYVAHSDWIEYEVNEAVRMSKIIIGVDNVSQLKTHLDTLKKNVDSSVFEEALSIYYENENILNPSLWPAKS